MTAVAKVLPTNPPILDHTANIASADAREPGTASIPKFGTVFTSRVNARSIATEFDAMTSNLVIPLIQLVFFTGTKNTPKNKAFCF